MILSKEEIKEVGEKILANKSIPEYCKNYIYNLQMRLSQARKEIEGLEQAHTLLMEYDWSSLGVYTKERRRLYMADKDEIRHVFSIGAGAVVLTGTKKEEK